MRAKKKAPKRKRATAKPKRATQVIRCSYAELVDPTKLKPNPGNPNEHTTEQLHVLQRIIEHQGWRAPVVVSKLSGLVVAGHARLQVAINAGWGEVPVDYQEFANKDDEWAHLLADNKIASLAELDFKGVAEILREMSVDVHELTGFRGFEIEPLLQAQWTPPPIQDLPKPHNATSVVFSDEQMIPVRDAVSRLPEPEQGDLASALVIICQQFAAK